MRQTPAHILIVFGTRPEAIKMIPLVQAIRARDSLRLTVAVTGQHRQMLDQVFRTFGQAPDIDLALMQPNQTLPAMTAAMIVKMSEVVESVDPDLVLVHGDTTTAMATGMAAFYGRKPLGHVEAGLRSHDLSRPWPEEFNRVAIDSIAEFLFAPTEGARANLALEGRDSGKVHVTGNTGIDALLYLSRLIDADGDLARSLADRYRFLDPARPLVLVTGHRRESFGDGLNRICEGLSRLADDTDLDIVYPVHLNPRVRETVMERLGSRPHIHLLDPVDYADMVYLMKRAAVVVTDSGGIQEEAPALGRPVLVTREVTERPEAVATGHVELVGTDPDLIYRRVVSLIDAEAPPIAPTFPYGDGTAAVQIADILEKELAYE